MGPDITQGPNATEAMSCGVRVANRSAAHRLGEVGPPLGAPPCGAQSPRSREPPSRPKRKLDHSVQPSWALWTAWASQAGWLQCPPSPYGAASAPPVIVGG